MVGIYKITSPTKKIYIGQSVNIEKRFNSYYNLHCEKQIILYNSLKKYGVYKHKFEILCECEITELNEKERYYQDLYSVLNKNGLNCILTESSDRRRVYGKKIKRKNSYIPTSESIKKGVETRKRNGSYVAWNKGIKGSIPTNSGSFKKGKIGNNWQYILDSLASGKSKSKIAKELGVNRTGIANAIRRASLKKLIKYEKSKRNPKRLLNPNGYKQPTR